LDPTARAGPSHHASQIATPAPSPSVFLIVMENRSYDQAISGGYIASLAKTYGVATNYHGVSHPSLPNYLAMTSGSTWGVADDGYHALPATGLGAQLSAAGVSWRAYMEGMPANCLASRYPYALKHNPFPFYGSKCPSEVVSFANFHHDMAKGGDVPRFVWITPDLCNDGHDCSTAVADRWLANVVPEIQATSAWKDGGLLVITWDEGEDSANHVLTLVIRPHAQPQTSKHYYDHYALLATIEDRLGVPRLGAAAKAAPMTDLMINGLPSIS
jgi:phospholipase C